MVLNQHNRGGGGGTSVNKTALFVVPSTPAGDARDTAIISLLQGDGWTVTEVADDAVVVGDATGKGLILISHGATDANVDGLFRTTAVPLFPLTELELVACDFATSVGNAAPQSNVNITATTPALGGFSTGTLTILTSGTGIGYGQTLGAGAQVLANTGTAGQEAVFVYDTGAAMLNGLTAPARRVYMGFSGQMGQRLNTAVGSDNDGQEMFLALCAWAATTGTAASVAPTAPRSLTSPAKTDLTVDLSWTASATGADQYEVFRVGYGSVGTTAGTTLQDTGLTENTQYEYYVVATLGGRSSQHSNHLIVITDETTPGVGYTRKDELQGAGYTEQEIADFVKITHGGGFWGGSKTVIPDPVYASHPLLIANYLATARTEAGFKATRITRFDLAQPFSGNANSLRSEREACTIIDGNGNFIYYEKTTTNNVLCTEIDTATKTVVQQFETSISHMSNDEREMIHPHPTLADTVWYAVGQNLERMNLRTGARTVMLSLGYTPAPDWANGDGNGMTNGCCVISDTTEQEVWIFDVAAEQAVSMAGGTRTLVSVASRPTITLPAPGGNSLDYAYTDGSFIYAVIKGGNGPGGQSGCFAYAPGVGYVDRVYGATGHYSRQRMTVSAALQTSHSVKVIPGLIGDFGGAFNTADSISVGVSFVWNGSGFDMTRTGRRNMPWNYTYNPPSGGQRAGVWDIPDIAALSMKAAHSQSVENQGNYITADFWAKECVLVFDLSRSDAFTVVMKNLTRENSPVEAQTEINWGRPCPDGTLLLFVKSYGGPPEGSSTTISTKKDIWMVEIPPIMSDTDIQNYLSM